LLKEAGFVIDHEHNHSGQCCWEMRDQTDPALPSAPGTLAGKQDVRLMLEWNSGTRPKDIDPLILITNFILRMNG
jgi:hypothetical protein